MDRLTLTDLETEVIVGEGIPSPLLPAREGRSKVAILTQPGATDIATKLAREVEKTELSVEVIGLPDRDGAKTLAVASSVYDALARFGLNRKDTVLGVGGGSVTDMSGFVAGTWMRGVESVLVPTTLVGAVDASIGGKTGLNLSGKNLVGVFWHPSRVVVDISQLDALPGYLIREGMSEAYKTGLIGDPGLVAVMDRSGFDSPLDEVVKRSIQVKAAIVGADSRESGIRAHLNFGHTFGHAIEFASTLSHGDAVAVGMVAALAISEKRFGFEGKDRVALTLGELGLPTSVSGMSEDRVVDLITRDKKHDGSGMRMVLLPQIGSPVIEVVDHSDIRVGLEAIGF